MYSETSERVGGRACEQDKDKDRIPAAGLGGRRQVSGRFEPVSQVRTKRARASPALVTTWPVLSEGLMRCRFNGTETG